MLWRADKSKQCALQLDGKHQLNSIMHIHSGCFLPLMQRDQLLISSELSFSFTSRRLLYFLRVIRTLPIWRFCGINVKDGPLAENHCALRKWKTYLTTCSTNTRSALVASFRPFVFGSACEVVEVLSRWGLLVRRHTWIVLLPHPFYNVLLASILHHFRV